MYFKNTVFCYDSEFYYSNTCIFKCRLINKTPKTFTHGIKEGQSQTFKGHGRLLKENQNEEEKK